MTCDHKDPYRAFQRYPLEDLKRCEDCRLFCEALTNQVACHKHRLGFNPDCMDCADHLITDYVAMGRRDFKPEEFARFVEQEKQRQMMARFEQSKKNYEELRHQEEIRQQREEIRQQQAKQQQGFYQQGGYYYVPFDRDLNAGPGFDQAFWEKISRHYRRTAGFNPGFRPTAPVAPSPYRALGLDDNASMDAVKTAYRKLAHEHHPDKGGDGKKMAEINNAYDQIKKERGMK